MISEGQLELSSNTYIVFDKTCNDVHVENIIIKGAMLLRPVVLSLHWGMYVSSLAFVARWLSGNSIIPCRKVHIARSGMV